LNEILNIAQDRANIIVLFFLFFTLKGPFSAVDILPTNNSLLFSFMTVPLADIFDRFDGSELVVTYIDVLSDPDKGFMNASNS